MTLEKYHGWNIQLLEEEMIAIERSGDVEDSENIIFVMTKNREIIINIEYFPLCTTTNLQEDGISRSTERNHEKTISIFPLSFFCLSFINLVGNDLEKE